VPAKSYKDPAQSQCDLLIAGIQLLGALQERQCFVGLLQPEQIQAKEEVRNEERRLLPKRLLEGLNRFAVFPQQVLHEAEIGADLSGVWLEREKFAVAGRGATVVTSSLGFLGAPQTLFQLSALLRRHLAGVGSRKTHKKDQDEMRDAGAGAEKPGPRTHKPEG
jgi:hypothetical protein